MNRRNKVIMSWFLLTFMVLLHKLQEKYTINYRIYSLEKTNMTIIHKIMTVRLATNNLPRLKGQV